MNKNKPYYGILLIIFLIGFAILMWASFKIDAYPGFKELRKLALASAKPQYIMGLVLVLGSYLLMSMANFKNMRK